MRVSGSVPPEGKGKPVDVKRVQEYQRLVLEYEALDEEIDALIAQHHGATEHMPDEAYQRYRELALDKGFLEVVSGPLVRSSYRAERVLEHNNVGLDEALSGIRESAAAALRC